MKSALLFSLLGKTLALVTPAIRADSNSIDLAPLHEPDDKDSIVQDRYAIALHEHAELSQHWDAIGIDLSQDSDACGDFVNIEGLKAYICTIKNSELLDEKIRGDKENVLQVDAESLGALEDDLTVSLNNSSGNGTIYRRWNKNQHASLGPYHIQQLAAGEKLQNIPAKAKWDRMENPLPGEGVNIYILDSGIRKDHTVFYPVQGNQSLHRVANFQGLDDEDRSPFVISQDGEASKMKDTTGHGTAMASIAGSWYIGTGLRATLINVKVSAPRPESNMVAKAIDAIVDEHIANTQSKPQVSGFSFKGSVINMSGRIEHSETLQRAVKRAYANGVPIAGSAGNMNTDIDPDTVGKKYPCAYDQVMCVGASTKEYKRWQKTATLGSNYGDLINVFAPGDEIYAASHTSPRAGISESGTGAATALVSGLMATILSYEGFERFTYAEGIYERLKANYLSDILEDIPEGTANALVTTGINHPNRTENCPYAGLTNDKCIEINPLVKGCPRF